jgi:hypothetical protein
MSKKWASAVGTGRRKVSPGCSEPGETADPVGSPVSVATLLGDLNAAGGGREVGIIAA